MGGGDQFVALRYSRFQYMHLAPGIQYLGVADDFAVVDSHGTVLSAGVAGEVVVRGPTVIAGYLDDPELNRSAFRDGWYRTGDLGMVDADGYLTLIDRKSVV